MTSCPECYSEKNRLTPIHHPIDCLTQHTQYICGTCHRCICIQKDKTRNLYRWNFPFKSLNSAKLYLRTAEYVLKKECGIYEIKLDKNRSTFKIFPGKKELLEYLKKNNNRKSSKAPVFKTQKYQEFPQTQVRKLTIEEVKTYLNER